MLSIMCLEANGSSGESEVANGVTKPQKVAMKSDVGPVQRTMRLRASGPSTASTPLSSSKKTSAKNSVNVRSPATEGDIHEHDHRPQNKLTHFSVYDKEGHLCPFDNGLIEKNTMLFFSGYMKAIYEENADPEGESLCCIHSTMHDITS
ncbi:hypothetical protein C0J52_02651 [Blattella germanica]|nr:hypothetical protein C0J52_02651 [Blattella germanica]